MRSSTLRMDSGIDSPKVDTRKTRWKNIARIMRAKGGILLQILCILKNCNAYQKIKLYGGGNYFGLPPTRGIICWDKYQMMPTFSRWEYAWTSFDCPARLFGCRPQDSARFHPIQKPIALYKWILQNYAKPGDIILDTHVGSASSLIACEELGFDYVGFEIDPEYYQKATQRINEFNQQVRMF